MKYQHILWASLAALALAACDTTMEIDNAPEGMKVLSVKGLRTEVTKTSYTNEKTFSWNVGDEVAILCNDGTDNDWEIFTASEAAASSALTAAVSDDTHIGSADGVKPALYPFAGHLYDDAANILFRLPHERDFRKSKGGHDESAIPMFAWGNDAQEFAFANMTGAIKFSFTNISATMVKFTFTSNGEKMSGLFPLTGLDSGNAADVSWDVATAGNEAEKSLTFYADVVGGTVSFYVPYPAGTLSAGSQVRLEDMDGNALYENTSLKAITVAKNQIVVLPTQVAGAINLAFTEASGEIMNPERGFYVPNQFSFRKTTDPPGRIHPGGGALQNAGLLADNSLIHLMFYLMAFLDQDAISEDALNDMQKVFDDVRTAGKKVILRFAYWWDNDPKNIDLTDPTLERLLKHIASLKPLLTKNEDVIYVVQAGFIGAWGEWFHEYSKHFPNYVFDGSDLYNDHGRGKVIEALLDAVPASRQVALRTPHYKGYYVDKKKYAWTPTTAWDQDRISFHNDGFRSSFKMKNFDAVTGTLATDDGGTFTSAEHRKMYRQQSAYLAVGGEMYWSFTSPEAFNRLFNYSWTGEEGKPYGDIIGKAGVTYGPYSYAGAESTLQALYFEHMSYLNGDATNPIMVKWDAEGRREEIRKALGYRLWLRTASIRTEGTSTIVGFTLRNSGAAPVINKRPMKLMLLRGDSATELADLGDVRELASRTEKDYELTITEPLQGGDKLAIWLPDNATTIQNRPEYAIRLANNETTFEGIGYNVFCTLP